MYVIIVATENRENIRLGDELKGQGFPYVIVSSPEMLAEQVNAELPGFLLVEKFGSPAFDEIYRDIKNTSNIPVIALTRLDAAANLTSVIDDFVIQPYNSGEIIARSLRLIGKGPLAAANMQIKIGDIAIDTENYEIFVQGRLVPLTFREYELLKCFADNPGKVFTREALLNRVWGEDYLGGDRTVDVHIRRLRSKIEDPEHIYIETVRNIGYRLKKILTI